MNARIVFATVSLVVAGCNLRQLTADSTADMLHAASSQFNTLEDLEFAEASVPASLVTMETVWRVSPHNQDILVELAAGYASYGFGFLEDHVERAQRADDAVRLESWRARTRAAYLRGRMYGFLLMRERVNTDGGPEHQLRGGIDGWRHYLERFASADDVPALFWAGNAWLSYIQQSLDDPSALLDVPFAVALMDRVRVLNPNYFNGGVHMFYGIYYASMPAALGGQPEPSRREFEEALRATGRRSLIVQVLYARNYAVMVQNRGLFRRLLEEVVAAGDINPSDRLTNQVAKRRAQRYLAMIDDLFGPEEIASSDPSSRAP